MRGRREPVRTGKDNDKGQPIYRLGAEAGAWSGSGEPPAIGDEVEVIMNSLGAGRVTSYRIFEGYLGVHVLFDNPPQWYIEQNGRNHAGLVFGAELRRWRPTTQACCADPKVRGGRCENCGTWTETGSDLPQQDNEG